MGVGAQVWTRHVDGLSGLSFLSSSGCLLLLPLQHLWRGPLPPLAGGVVPFANGGVGAEDLEEVLLLHRAQGNAGHRVPDKNEEIINYYLQKDLVRKRVGIPGGRRLDAV